ncbi:MAG TPA: TfoX/Sxy family protein [Candidatus Binatia bacterium]|jgi:DNA transformation protein
MEKSAAADAVVTPSAQDDSFADFILDQLRDLPDLECRAMFGGHGLYQDEIFFGIIAKGRLYFKTDEKSSALYRRRGMKAFRPNAKQTLKNYYEVPGEVLEDGGEIAAWARAAIAVARERSHRRR